MIFWLITICISILCWIVTALKFKDAIRKEWNVKDDEKITCENSIADTLEFIALLIIPIVNVLFALVIMIGVSSDRVMEEFFKKCKERI